MDKDNKVSQAQVKFESALHNLLTYIIDTLFYIKLIRMVITCPQSPTVRVETFDAIVDASSWSTIQHRQPKTIQVADLLITTMLSSHYKKNNEPLFSL